MARRRPALSAALSALAGILILASGCVDRSPTSVQLKAPTALQAARTYSGGAYTASIGTEGGILEFPIGRIVFPAGAVSAPTVITATVDGHTLSVDFQPHLVFPEGAQPTLSVSFGGVLLDASKLTVYHINDDGTLTEQLTPFVDLTRGVASVNASSFSRFALATN